MDDFEDFRARSYSGGFIQALHRSRPLVRRRISLNAELATRGSSSRSPHPEASNPISESNGLGLLLFKTFGSKHLKGGCGYDEAHRRNNGEAEAGTDARGIDWDDRDMRPRVSSAPTSTCVQRSRRMTDARDSPSQSPSRHFQKVRSFSLTQKGVVCQGYTYVRSSADVRSPAEGSTFGFAPVVSGSRNYASKDVAVGGAQQVVPPEVSGKSMTRHRNHWYRHFRLQLMGGRGTGKSSILAHFVRPDSNLHSNATDDSPDGSPVDGSQSSIVCTALDGQLYELDITEMTIRKPVQSDFLVSGSAADIDGCLVVFSVEDRRSFELAIDCLYEIRTRLRIAATVVTLAANKSDLVRTRVISEQEGRSAAKTYGNRYIEVSATIGINIDQLLIGTLKQMCLLKRSGSGSTSSAASAVHHVQDDTESRTGSVLASLGLRLPCFDPSSCVCLLCARRSALVKLLRQ